MENYKRVRAAAVALPVAMREILIADVQKSITKTRRPKAAAKKPATDSGNDQPFVTFADGRDDRDRFRAHATVLGPDCDEQEFADRLAAERWCKELGFKVGSMQSGSPSGLARSFEWVPKWRHLDEQDLAELDGILYTLDDGHRTTLVAVKRAALAAVGGVT